LNTLSVWRFETPQAAEAALPRLERLVSEGIVDIDDAALVSWPRDQTKPSIRGLGSVTGPGRLWGGFWGMLLGLIFLTPIAGPLFGAAAGAVAVGLSDFGIEDDFVKRTRERVTPGTSAVFLVTTGTVADRLAVELPELAAGGLRSGLSDEQEEHLRTALGEESAPPQR
jgi:uncharacterized membrane protein